MKGRGNNLSNFQFSSIDGFVIYLFIIIFFPFSKSILFFKISHLLLVRHLRFLLRSAEKAVENPPTISSLGNTVAAQGAEIKAIKTQLAKTTEEKDLNFAKFAELSDGLLNEE